jgi:hypothetical protein
MKGRFHLAGGQDPPSRGRIRRRNVVVFTHALTDPLANLIEKGRELTLRSEQMGKDCHVEIPTPSHKISRLAFSRLMSSSRHIAVLKEPDPLLDVVFCEACRLPTRVSDY